MPTDVAHCQKEWETEKSATGSKINDGKNSISMEIAEEKSAKKRFRQSYAIASFPDEVQLCVSGIPGAGYGVCAKRHIPVGTWIGPYEGRRVSPDCLTSDLDTSYMWEVRVVILLSYLVSFLLYQSKKLMTLE